MKTLSICEGTPLCDNDWLDGGGNWLRFAYGPECGEKKNWWKIVHLLTSIDQGLVAATTGRNSNRTPQPAVKPLWFKLKVKKKLPTTNYTPWLLFWSSFRTVRTEMLRQALNLNYINHLWNALGWRIIDGLRFRSIEGFFFYHNHTLDSHFETIIE